MSGRGRLVGRFQVITKFPERGTLIWGALVESASEPAPGELVLIKPKNGKPRTKRVASVEHREGDAWVCRLDGERERPDRDVETNQVVKKQIEASPERAALDAARAAYNEQRTPDSRAKFENAQEMLKRASARRWRGHPGMGSA